MMGSASRVVMIGDFSVGKTSLVHRMCLDKWIDTTPQPYQLLFTPSGGLTIQVPR